MIERWHVQSSFHCTPPKTFASPTNFLAFNNNVRFDDNLKQLDVCINFPIAEITYKGELIKPFHKDDERLYDLYGHVFASRFLAGGQLFVKNINFDSSKQINNLKFYLIWAYNLD